MDKEKWQKTKGLFHEAQELAANERKAFLDKACDGDPILREQVENLLGAYESGFMEDSVVQKVAAVIGGESDLKEGQTIGRYQIKRSIGVGGMGEVFLADDTELNRPVAFKFLHRDVAEDSERVRRFIQEARAASALNHPNILTSHEIGAFEGANYIVSEFINGETLRERMHHGLTVAESLDVAAQVATALQAAHEAGIVHRDIKPENIMIRRDGLVKVLDFGLAKLTEADDHLAEVGNAERGVRNEGAETIVHSLSANPHSALRNPHLTAPGLVMGTVAYMSPEQARGQSVDSRTDLWSLGVVLHEMLTGESPFEGETVTELITSILKKDGPSFDQAKLPQELQSICRKALTRDKQARYQSSQEFRQDLQGEKKKMEYAVLPDRLISVSSTDDAQKTQLIRRRPTLSAEYIVGSVKRHKYATLATVLFVITSAIGLSVYRYNGATPPAAERTFGVIDASTTEKDLKISRFAISDRVTDIAISPDGKLVAYVAGFPNHLGIRVRDLGTQNEVDVVPIPAGDKTAELASLVFTPDGTHILYRDDSRGNDEGIYSVAVTGGASVKIADKTHTAAISPDGKTISFYRYIQSEDHKWQGTDLVLANVDGTNQRTLVHTPSTDSWIETDIPAWSADGKWLAGWQHLAEGGYKLYAISIADGSKRDFGEQKWSQISSAIWMPDGSLVICGLEYGSSYLSPHQLWRVTESSKAKVITTDAVGYRKLSGTRDGSMLVALQSQVRFDLWRMDGTDASSARQITFSGELSQLWQSSEFGVFPDGSLVITSTITAGRQLWRMNADGSGRKQLTDHDTHIDPHVTPDGRFIVFSSDRESKAGGHVFRMDPDGGNVKQLNDIDYTRVIGISGDSKWIYYRVMQKDETGHIYKVPIDGGTSSLVAKASAKGETYDASPKDGRIAEYYASEDGKIKELRIYSSGAADPKRVTLPATATGGPIRWTPDGTSVVFQDTRNQGANLWSIRVDGKTAARPLTNFTSLASVAGGWSPDGKRLIISRAASTYNAMMITNIRE